MEKKEGGGVGFANKTAYEYEGIKYEADLKEGDTIKILSGGEKEAGQFGEQTNFIISTRNGEKKLSFNQSTINVLVDELGEESENWIDKEVKVIFQRRVINKKKVIVVYLVVGNWAIDKWGELSKPKEGQVVSPDNVDEINEDDIDTINANI